MQLYQEYSVKVYEKEKELKGLDEEYNEKKDEYLKIRAQHNSRKKKVLLLIIYHDS